MGDTLRGRQGGQQPHWAKDSPCSGWVQTAPQPQTHMQEAWAPRPHSDSPAQDPPQPGSHLLPHGAVTHVLLWLSRGGEPSPAWGGHRARSQQGEGDREEWRERGSPEPSRGQARPWPGPSRMGVPCLPSSHASTLGSGEPAARGGPAPPTPVSTLPPERQAAPCPVTWQGQLPAAGLVPPCTGRAWTRGPAALSGSQTVRFFG